MNSSIYIGRPYNLLDDFDHTGSQSKANALEEALQIPQVKPVINTGFTWAPVTLNLLSNWQEIAKYCSSFELSSTAYDGKHFFISPNLLSDKTEEHQAEILSERLNFKFNVSSKYIVLELRKTDKTLSHEVYKHSGKASFVREKHLSKKWQFDSVKLHPGKKIRFGDQYDTELNSKKAQKYIDKFYEYGTHFISNIEYGDRLLQFFEIENSSLDQIVNLYQSRNKGLAISGQETSIFNIFLNRKHCTSISNIISLANEKELNHTLEKGIFHESSSGQSSLLMTGFWNEQMLASNLKSFESNIETRITLSSIGRFLGYFRAINYDRILKASLAQRWGEKVDFSIRRLDNVSHKLKAIDWSLNAELKNKNASFHFGDRIQLTNSTNEHEVPHLDLFRVISLTDLSSNYSLFDNSLSCQYLESSDNTKDAVRLVVADASFSNPKILCSKMYGSFILVNEKTGFENLVYDGYRFNSYKDNASKKIKIQITESITELTDELKPNIQDFLELASDLLTEGITNWKQNFHDTSRLRSFSSWISELLSFYKPEDKLTILHSKYSAKLRMNTFLDPINLSSAKDKIMSDILNFLSKISSLDRYNAAIYNTESLYKDNSDSKIIYDSLIELEIIEKNILSDYEQILSNIYGNQYQEYIKIAINRRNKEVIFIQDLIEIKSYLEDSEVDDIVHFILNALSQTTKEPKLFPSKKNAIKTRFEESKIALAREFSSLQNEINIDFEFFFNQQELIGKETEGINSENLEKFLMYDEQTHEIEEHYYFTVYGQIQTILLDETSHISEDITKQLKRMFKSFEALMNSQQKFTRNIRSLYDLQLSLLLNIKPNSDDNKSDSILLRLNSIISRLQSKKNQIKSFQRDIHLKGIESKNTGHKLE